MGHTNIVIKILSIKILKRGVELKSLWHFCGLHLHMMEQMKGYILNFKSVSSTLFVSEKKDSRNFYV